MSYKTRLQNLTKKSLIHAATGAKGSALSLAVGFAGYHLHTWAASQTWAQGKSLYLVPLGMAILGHFLKGKAPAVGVALLGSAGYALGFAMAAMKMQKQGAAGFSSGEAALLNEARGIDAFGDAGFIQDPAAA